MSAKRIVSSIATVLAVTVWLGYSERMSASPWIGVETAVLAQTPSADSTPAEKRAKADDLLRRARQAMSENDLTAANQLIGEAQSLHVQYGPLHFGDTPERAARDLEKRRAAAAAGNRPSQLFQPVAAPATDAKTVAVEKANSPAAPVAADPTAAVPRMPALAGAPNGLNPFGKTASPLPTVGAEDQLPGVLTPSPAAQPAPGAGATNQLLLQSRRALAVGDVRRANTFLEQAKALPAARGLYDDTPENVESLVRKYNDLMSLPQDRQNTEGFRREYARLAMEQAEGLLRRGDFDEAERMTQQAANQRVPFGPMDTKPELLLQRIAASRQQSAAATGTPGTLPPVSAQPMAAPAVSIAAVPPVTNVASKPAPAPTAGSNGGVYQANSAFYDQNQDRTRNVAASAVEVEQVPTPPAAGPVRPAQAEGSFSATPAVPANGKVGVALLEQGEAALKANDPERAMNLFRQALVYRDLMDPASAQRLQDRLHAMSAQKAAQSQKKPSNQPSIVDESIAKQQMLTRQIEADLLQEEANAKSLMATDPKKAVELLEKTRKKIETAGLEPAAREVLLRHCDRTLSDVQRYINENLPRIELDEKNRQVKTEVAREQRVKLEVQDKIKSLTHEFNQLMHEQRFAEAEVLAKRAKDLDPDNPVCVQLMEQSQMSRRLNAALATRNEKADKFVAALQEVEDSDIPFAGKDPMIFPKNWKEISGRPGRRHTGDKQRKSERELEIEQKLNTPVAFEFKNEPLGKVIERIGQLAGVNVVLDPVGLQDEGATSESPVNIKISHEIALKSALKHILEPLRLSYVIKDEVLKITSQAQRGGPVYTVTYNVADLVTPIPNFTPGRMGLENAYDKAMQGVGFGVAPPFGSSNTVVASRDGARLSGSINPAVLAQMPGAGTARGPQVGAPGGAAAGANNSNMVPFGPGGASGGSAADFDSLINLITSTVKPTTWDTVGGNGSIAPFETNLSLVVSQTQEVHEDIRDLLEQLRRLQDLQVTIEVRFITLSDRFYERIGVSFDFDLNSNVDRPYQIFGRQDPTISTQYVAPASFSTNSGVPRNIIDRDLHGSQSATVGLASPNLFSADLDVPVNQGSYALTVPQFGSVPATAPYGGAQLGFAILSDIEAYFFLNAAQGDQRSNVLQAPKVTLFNGQQAFVSDTSQSPFVISVIPVVGDFAAAQQPVIVVLSEGTFLTVQAVVSDDRRFVRLTIVPFFSKIGDVRTFTFTGKQTTSESTTADGVQDTPNDSTKKKTDKTTTSEGTTVQLPTFSFVTVTTTVSVPDGGTVLLGGIKRLSEERREYGVPILNKLPYINRLFSNVGVGRDTQSLMMMVTPRIIIQEEEEQQVTGNTNP